MRRATLLLLVGVAFASSSSILIRGASSHPLVAATYRMGIAAAVMGGLSLWRHRRLFPHWSSWRDGLLVVAAGLLLGIHFASWMTSLAHTSIATSVIVVDSAPFVVAGLSAVFFHERLGRDGVIGISLAFIGALAIVFHEISADIGLRGVALAAIGACSLAGYLVIGRGVRSRLPLLPYVSAVYAIAFLFILCIAAGGGYLSSWPPAGDLLLFAALALGPSCFGHTVYNKVMDVFPATTVSVAIVAEPVGASVLAWAFFGEVPGVLVFVGGALILSGVILVMRA